MTKRFDEKVVTVLDVVKDIQRVVDRYSRKGWEATSYKTEDGPPRSVKIKLRKPKKQNP